MKTKMRFVPALAFIVCVVFVGFRGSEATPQEPVIAAKDASSYVPNEVLIKFKTGTAAVSIAESIAAAQGAIVTTRKELILPFQ
jgi:hypothetical protein